MTGKLMFVPDTHVVVPKSFLARAESAYATTDHVVREIRLDEAFAILKAAPPLTTPPVLRWEGAEDGSREFFMCGKKIIACVIKAKSEDISEGITWFVAGEQPWHSAFSVPEARRAAEKALGLPIVEEV